MPASQEEFERRVRARNPNMSHSELSERMRIARTEMKEHALEYDYQIQNADERLTEAASKSWRYSNRKDILSEHEAPYSFVFGSQEREKARKFKC